MPRIRFNKDFSHADDGVTIITHKAGTEQDVSDMCALAATRDGAGEKVATKIEPPASPVAVQPAPKTVKAAAPKKTPKRRKGRKGGKANEPDPSPVADADSGAGGGRSEPDAAGPGAGEGEGAGSSD